MTDQYPTARLNSDAASSKCVYNGIVNSHHDRICLHFLLVDSQVENALYSLFRSSILIISSL
jgi:hypothetical protein